MYIVSTIGFSKSDENIFLDKVEGAKHVQAEYQMDSYFTFKNEKFEGRENIRTFKSSAVDKLELVEGNFPKSKDECVILTFDQTNKNLQIGSSIYINKEEKKVVGTVKDPFYLGTAGDATSIGDGSIDLVAYFDEQYFENLEYSLLRIVYHDSYKYDSFEIDYQRYINEKVNLVEQIKQEMIDIRLASIKETRKEEATKAVKEELRQTLINAGMSDEEQINTIIENLVATDLVQTQIDATADEILFTSQPSASTGHVQFLLYSTYAASDPISICPFITEIPPSTVHIIGRRTPMKLNTGSYFTIVLASDILRS